MTDNTTTTDSVKWALGNSGTFYGSIHAKKAEGLEVGFLYSQNADMSDAKTVKGTFRSDADSVFTASLDAIKVGIYYLRAYTKLNGIVHTANIFHFGAQAVDLGLTSGVKWVDMNLGTDNEEGTVTVTVGVRRHLMTSRRATACRRTTSISVARTSTLPTPA